MEHAMRCPHDGTVAEVRVVPGAQVETGAVLVVVSAEEAEPTGRPAGEPGRPGPGGGRWAMAEVPWTSEVVRYEVDDGVAWLTIDRPEARNALSQAVRDGLWAGARRFQLDETAAVLVLTGRGDQAFCAGADLKEMAATSLQVPPLDFLPQFGRNIVIDKPIIAAVNGVAYAGGFALAQTCDLVVAADHARFAITEARVGRGAPWAAPLPWLIPPRVALQILMTAEPIDAARAHQIGLVNEVVPLADLGTGPRPWPGRSPPTPRSRCGRPSAWCTTWPRRSAMPSCSAGPRATVGAGVPERGRPGGAPSFAEKRPPSGRAADRGHRAPGGSRRRNLAHRARSWRPVTRG